MGVYDGWDRDRVHPARQNPPGLQVLHKRPVDFPALGDDSCGAAKRKMQEDEETLENTETQEKVFISNRLTECDESWRPDGQQRP